MLKYPYLPSNTKIYCPIFRRPMQYLDAVYIIPIRWIFTGQTLGMPIINVFTVFFLVKELRLRAENLRLFRLFCRRIVTAIGSVFCGWTCFANRWFGGAAFCCSYSLKLVGALWWNFRNIPIYSECQVLKAHLLKFQWWWFEIGWNVCVSVWRICYFCDLLDCLVPSLFYCWIVVVLNMTFPDDMMTQR